RRLRDQVRLEDGEKGGVTLVLVDQAVGEGRADRTVLRPDQEVDVRDLVPVPYQRFTDQDVLHAASSLQWEARAGPPEGEPRLPAEVSVAQRLTCLAYPTSGIKLAAESIGTAPPDERHRPRRGRRGAARRGRYPRRQAAARGIAGRLPPRRAACRRDDAKHRGGARVGQRGAR